MLDPERIRMGRQKMRLSQKRLGEMVGQDQAYISRLERGAIKEITVRTLERLANVLQVSTDFLLAREEAPPPSTAYRHEDEHDGKPTSPGPVTPDVNTPGARASTGAPTNTARATGRRRRDERRVEHAHDTVAEHGTQRPPGEDAHHGQH